MVLLVNIVALLFWVSLGAAAVLCLVELIRKARHKPDSRVLDQWICNAFYMVIVAQIGAVILVW